MWITRCCPLPARTGTPALTSRGFGPADFVKVASFFDRAVKIAQDVSKALGPGHKLVDFKANLAATTPDALKALRTEVRHAVSSSSL